MRLLADENIPLHSVRALRDAGHDVYSATEDQPGQTDRALLERAVTERRLIITFDTDFGELVVRGPRLPQGGVLLLRSTPQSAAAVTELLVTLLARTDIAWEEHLSVVDDLHIRQRPF